MNLPRVIARLTHSHLCGKSNYFLELSTWKVRQEGNERVNTHTHAHTHTHICSPRETQRDEREKSITSFSCLDHHRREKSGPILAYHHWHNPRLKHSLNVEEIFNSTYLQSISVCAKQKLPSSPGTDPTRHLWTCKQFYNGNNLSVWF